MQIYTLDYIVLRSTGLRVSLLFFTLHPSYMRCKPFSRPS